MSCSAGSRTLRAGARLGLACAAILAMLPTSATALDLQQLMTENRVPAVSIAVISKGKIVQLKIAGVRNATSAAPADPDTIFGAASLSKPVFAYLVLQLVDAGVLSLDEPLARIVPDFVPKDPQAASITVRQVLSHTTGLPNWRNAKQPLKTYFPPGEKFSYSGEAFLWLQRAVQVKTGESIDTLAQRLVFGPLRMRRSSFVWRPEFDANFADPHDADLVPTPKYKSPSAKVAGSLQTTAADYARFMLAVMSGARLKPATARLWLQPQVRLKQQCFLCIDSKAPEGDQRVAWGLGWGLEADAGTFFHWGDAGRYMSFAVGSVAKRSGVVVLVNGANGMVIMPDLVGELMPGDHPAFAWLNYPRQPPPPTPKEAKEPKEAKNAKDPKDPKNGKEPKDAKNGKDGKNGK
jgi:CubicO group peptidase (beta-lactamase class C family)